MDSHLRSVAKAISWRVGGSIVTTLIALAVTRQTALALSIGVADVVVKVAAYYVHERLWDRISFGRGKSPDYQI